MSEATPDLRTPPNLANRVASLDTQTALKRLDSIDRQPERPIIACFVANARRHRAAGGSGGGQRRHVPLLVAKKPRQAFGSGAARGSVGRAIRLILAACAALRRRD